MLPGTLLFFQPVTVRSIAESTDRKVSASGKVLLTIKRYIRLPEADTSSHPPRGRERATENDPGRPFSF